MKTELLWYSLGGLVLSFGLYFIQKWVTFFPEVVVQVVFWICLGVFGLAMLMQVLVAVKKWWGEMRGD